ncbi:MAG: hypothetical protein Q8L54_11960 [Devosia sp.]|nr:hypothetical protein [Devosia sp.]
MAMKSVTPDVGGLLSIPDFAVVEKRLTVMPGVLHVAMNAGSTSATVEFDDEVTSATNLA